MKTAMVIVNYNDSETTIKLLNNVKEYKCLDKIIVVDNKSTDDSYKKLKYYENKKIDVIDSGKNNGYSYALNIGCKYAIDAFKECNLIISNSDIIIDSENDLVELINTLSEKNVIVGPTIIENNTLNRGWHIPTPIDDIMLNIVKYHDKYFNKHLKYSESYYNKHLSKVDTVSGSFFLIRSTHLEDIDYFDENVFLYYEENIFGIKTKRLNKNIVVNNDVDVVHNHSVTINKNIKRIKKYKILKKSQYYFEKEYNNANIFERILLKVSSFITKIIYIILYTLRIGG